MKIVVTGATSFIGKAFIRKLAQTDCEIIAVVRKNSPKINFSQQFGNIRVVELDMDEYAEIDSYIPHMDCLVHLAWAGTRGSNRMNRELNQLNYKNSVTLTEKMIQVGCQKIITAGSQAEYGLHSGIITEETPCLPNTEYGIYKYKLFNYVRNVCIKSGIRYKEPRFFSIYGKEDYEKTLIMSLISNMRKNAPCELTECIQMWDFLYIEDAVSALTELCLKDCADGVYNFGSGDIRPLKDYIEEMKVILNSKSPLHYGKIPYPSTGMVSIQPCIRKLQTQLHWQPRYSFKRGIQEMIQ